MDQEHREASKPKKSRRGSEGDNRWPVRKHGYSGQCEGIW